MGDLPQKSSYSTQGKQSSSFSIERKCSGRVLINEVNDNDVLQGRGSGSMQNSGNIRFRSLVEELRPSYVATSSRKQKAKMISDMIQLIQSRNGRFLQRLCDREVEKLGLDSNNGENHKEQENYIEMTNDEAAEKAKQAIRYVHYKKVPLEEERRKKRAADNNFFTHSSRTGSNKTNSEATHRNEYGGNASASTPISANVTNQLTQSQDSRSNVRSGVTIPPQLQQTDFSQLLATLQTTQTALTAQVPVNIYSASHAPVHQTSTHRNSAQQASVMQQVTGGVLPIVGNVQQQPNTLQRLASSLFPNSNSALSQKVSHASSTLLNTTGNQNVNQQQLPQQQTQLNILLQNLLQQQTSSQPNSILQTILQQQQQHQHQQQQQLNSALQTLQQQHQLKSTIQSLQQPQQLSSDPQFQQHLQQQKKNSILASLLSNANTIPQASSTLCSVTNQPVLNMNSTAIANPQPTMEATNALLTSFLSNNIPQASAFQQTANSHAPGTGKSGQLLGGLLPSMNMNDTNVILTTTGQQQQQNQGLLGASTLQAISGLAQNVNTLLAANANNNTQGQVITSTIDRNTAKRPRLSLENNADHPV